MPPRKRKEPLRSIICDIPEAEVLKIVRLAREEGTSTREVASRKLLSAMEGVK